MKELRVVIAGFGVVGEAFASLLLEKELFLRERHDLQVTVVGIGGSSKGSILNNGGISLAAILRAKKDGISFDKVCEGTGGLSTIDLIKQSAADLLVEVTPTNFIDGLPGFDHINLALDKGFHVVTVNKGPIALFYKRLSEKACKKGVKLKIEGTVISGTPVISLIESGLRGAEILSVRGILNGTTNYILCEMEEGADYSAALQKAQDLGYAETDPTGDVEGHDAAGKVLILANAIMGGDLSYSEVECKGISQICW
jgi:homoserine dehydrogenase